MALVEGDQADVGQGREERAARADDDLKQAFAGAPPGIIALTFGELGMDKANLTGKTRHEAAHSLRGKRDLGHEYERSLAAPDGFFGCADVQFGLAGAGHTVQEKG